MNDTGKSITNLEFSEAEARGIPKYVFVKSEILTLLPIWRANPEADFSSAVDTPKLFEFVSQLRDSGEVWVFPFGNAQDIMSALRKQLSYLFSDCLDLRAKMQISDPAILQLGPESLRIFVEKPRGWEYLLFAKLLQERIQSQESKRLDAELGISFGPLISLPDLSAALKWSSENIDQLLMTIRHLSLALESGFEKAVGKPGEPGNIRRIVHLASRIADGYAQVLEWTLEFHRISVDSELEKLMNLASRLSTKMLAEIEEFSEELYGRFQHALANSRPGEVVKFTLTLTAPDTTEFLRELESLKPSVAN
jgi:hypothetical protein